MAPFVHLGIYLRRHSGCVSIRQSDDQLRATNFFNGHGASLRYWLVARLNELLLRSKSIAHYKTSA